MRSHWSVRAWRSHWTSAALAVLFIALAIQSQSGCSVSKIHVQASIEVDDWRVEPFPALPLTTP